jgi:mono/diheme cytochrome c family protein
LILVAVLNGLYDTFLNAPTDNNDFFCATESPMAHVPDSLLIASQKGKYLFRDNCAACHSRDMKTNSTGPALGGTEERWAAYPKEDLYGFIRNSQLMINNKHPKAVEQWNAWKPVVMTTFLNLTDEEIEAILVYINGY